MADRIKILGISGSLRSNSSNTNVLKSVAGFKPDEVELIIFEGLDQMPHFNPGLEEDQCVLNFKTAISNASAVIFCTPEYAFGVPGVLKNALDWTVSTGELNDKPVSVISASPLNSGGGNALASLLLTLTALGTKKTDASSLSIPNIKSKSSPAGVLTDENTLELLKNQLDNLLKLIG